MNKDKFRAGKRTRPTGYVPAPQLAGILFDEGEPARLKVRGLDANEIFLANQRRDENNPVRAMVKALQDSGQLKDGLADAFRAVMGDAKVTTAAQTAYSTELIVMGTIDEEGKPVLDYEDVARLGEHFPLVYLQLFNRIKELSGEASVLSGEVSARSGTMIESEARSTSARPEANSSSKSSPIGSHTDGSPTLN